VNRREVLRILGGAAAVPALAPFPPEARLAIGRALHDRAAGRPLRTLNPRQHALLSRIADIIIPETDTPGAAAVGVDAFIDQLLTDWYEPADRDRLLAGLEDIDWRSRQVHGVAFGELAASDQALLLESLDGRRGAPGSAEHAVRTLKDLTVYGYFTSEVVMRDVLRHPVIPGRHDGCIPA
jgi:hypothetical protein